MKSLKQEAVNHQVKNIMSALFMAVMFVCALTVPELALAASGDDGSLATGKVEGFFDKLNGLLNVASIAIVTIAVVFAGYQIAFAHKRISDVAPVLIGGFLIGAAAQLAKMLLGTDSDLETAMLINALPMIYA